MSKTITIQRETLSAIIRAAYLVGQRGQVVHSVTILRDYSAASSTREGYALDAQHLESAASNPEPYPVIYDD